ncbi:MAG: addiction module protein [Burkholderiaceae bacterium]|nr:addiction module protein [Burkholderiaceae bacterium]
MPIIDLIGMPVAEKLKLMETLWDSLCAQSTSDIGMPVWHGEVLEERLSRLASGEESVSAWKDAKERIRAQVKAG